MTVLALVSGSLSTFPEVTVVVKRYQVFPVFELEEICPNLFPGKRRYLVWHESFFCWLISNVLHLFSQTSRVYYSFPSINYSILDCQLISQAVVGSCLQGQITLVIWPSLENQGFHNLQGLVGLGFSLDLT